MLPENLKEIVALLVNHVTTDSDRRALLARALGPDHGLLRRLDYTGNAENFATNTATTLYNYGQLSEFDPRQAIWALLQAIYDQCGVEDQGRIRALEPVINNPYPAGMLFISYSRANRDFVAKLIPDLQAHGIQVWIDQQGLTAGTPDWQQAIRDAIRASSAVLLIASLASRQSRYVVGELEIAAMYRRPVFPVWADGDQWADCVPLELIATQYIDARGPLYATALAEIVRAVGTPPSVIFPPPAPPMSPTTPAPSQIPAPAAAQPEPDPRNPYKGLRAFTDQDTGDFFGRDKLVSALVDTLRTTLADTDSPRFIAVIVGPSGSGKSSVVMAGLLPKLRQGALPGSDKWVYLDPMVPGDHPMERLTLALSGVITERSMESIREDLDSDSARGLHLLASRAANIAKRPEMRLVLLVDQFEELFTLTTDEDERRHFIDVLVNAVTEPRGAVVAILTLRADFYDRPMQYAALGKLVETASKSVLPMDIDDLRAVIERPAALPDVRLTFDDGLVGDLLFEVRGEPAPLPLLQFTLDQLFERRDGRRLTRQAYLDIGGVKGALAKHAEATYAALPTDEHRRLTRALYLRLIEPGVTEQDTTRRRAALTELTLPDAEQTRLIQQCAERFIHARLLTTNEAAGSRTIEVSHEALIREWARLGGWLREAREDIRLQQALSQDAADWRRYGQRSDDLYRGQKLIDIQQWEARNVASADEMAFIEASAAAQAAAAQTERERQARELQLAKQAAENAERAEAAEAARAVRFEEAARNASRRARVAAIVAGIAAFGIVLAIIAAVAAAGQTASANNQLGTAQAARSTLELDSTISAFDVNRVGTLLPRIAQFPPTYAPTQSWPQKIATATAIATAYQWIPRPTQDASGAVLVEVPPGCFLMGDASISDARPVSEVCFDKPFWIDQFTVTNKQYAAFVAAGGYKDTPEINQHWTTTGLQWRATANDGSTTWLGDPKAPNPDTNCTSVSNTDQQPVVCVTWYEAYAYCQWRGARLPTEAEYEYAARGPASWVYPWGDVFDDDKVVWVGNSGGKAAVVGSRPKGVSWVGAFDLSGNVWQWVSSAYRDYPYATADGRESSNLISNDQYRVLRGGSWYLNDNSARGAIRSRSSPEFRDNYWGFRCARF